MFKKLGALAITPELNIDRYNIFLDKKLQIVPNQHILLHTSLALDVKRNYHISVKDNIGNQIPYEKRDEIIIPFHNNTSQIINFQRGTSIGHFFLYRLVEPRFRVLHTLKEYANFVQIKLESSAILPRKVGDYYILYCGSDYEILPNQTIQLDSGVSIKTPDNFGVSVLSLHGPSYFVEGQPLLIAFQNEANVITHMKHKDPICKIQFYEVDSDPEIVLVERFQGERKRKRDEDLPCTTKSLF